MTPKKQHAIFGLPAVNRSREHSRQLNNHPRYIATLRRMGY